MILAARGTRHLDIQEEAIDDAVLVTQLRQQARRVHRLALAAAAGGTLLLLALPGAG